MNQTETRKSFSSKNPWLQIAWDSTSLGTFKECARKYALQIIQGYQPRNEAHHLRYGQLYHRALEVYDHKIFEGLHHNEAQIEMLRDLAEGCQDHVQAFAAENIPADYDFEQLMNTPLQSTKNIEVVSEEPVLIRKWWNPSEHLTEKAADANTKTIPNLFRTVVWYTEHFRNDPLKTVRLADGKPAVELSFRFTLGCESKTGEEFLYCGHLDRLAEDQIGAKWVVDRKTTKNTIGFNFFNSYSPDNQMSGYTVAGNIVLNIPVKGVIIDAVQIAKGFSSFSRGYANRTAAQLDEWLSTTTFYITTLAQSFAERASAGAGLDAYPMNDKACHNYSGCIFRDNVCSKDPRMREQFLKANYKIRKWDPLEVRGDI